MSSRTLGTTQHLRLWLLLGRAASPLLAGRSCSAAQPFPGCIHRGQACRAWLCCHSKTVLSLWDRVSASGTALCLLQQGPSLLSPVQVEIGLLLCWFPKATRGCATMGACLVISSPSRLSSPFWGSRSSRSRAVGVSVPGRAAAGAPDCPGHQQPPTQQVWGAGSS